MYRHKFRIGKDLESGGEWKEAGGQVQGQGRLKSGEWWRTRRLWSEGGVLEFKVSSGEDKFQVQGISG
jgi:hypothetical protein